MKWLGIFNIGYGGLGLVAALSLGRWDAILLCVWVMVSGFLLRSGLMQRFLHRLRSTLSRMRRGVLLLDDSMRVDPVI